MTKIWLIVEKTGNGSDSDYTSNYFVYDNYDWAVDFLDSISKRVPAWEPDFLFWYSEINPFWGTEYELVCLEIKDNKNSRFNI